MSIEASINHSPKFISPLTRKRRCGWLDIPVLQHSNRINGYAAIALTKLDILDTLDEVKIGVAYTLDGQTLKGLDSRVASFSSVSPRL